MTEWDKEKVNVAEDVLAEARKQTENLTRGCLSDMVTVLNEQKLKLLMTIKDLKQQLTQQKQDQADIYFYLNKKCDDSFEVIAALEEQMATEQADREISEKIFEKKIVDMQHNADASQVKLKGRITELEDKLASMKEFGDKKDDLEKQLHNLIDTLDMERRQYTQIMEDMENRQILERNKLQREYAHKQQQIQSEINAKVDDNLSVVTKETQFKNVGLKHELRYQSVQADKVLHISQNIIERDKTMKIELDLSKASEKELINKLGTYQKVIKQLNEKIEIDNNEYSIYKEETAKSLEDCKETIADLQSKLRGLQDKNHLEDSHLDEMWIFLSSSYQALKSNLERTGKAGRLKQNSYVSSSSNASLTVGGSTQKRGDYEGLLHDLIFTLLESHPHRFANVIDDYLESNPHHAESKASNQRIDSLSKLIQLDIGEDSLYSVSPDGGFLPSINGGRSKPKDKDGGPGFGMGVSWAESSSIISGQPKTGRSIGIQCDIPMSAPWFSRMPPDLMAGLGLGGQELIFEDGSHNHSIFSAPNNPFGGLDENSSESISAKSAYYGQANYNLGNRRSKGGAKGGSGSKHVKASYSGGPTSGRVPGGADWSQKDELKKENIRLQKYIPAPVGSTSHQNNYNQPSSNKNSAAVSPKQVSSLLLGIGPSSNQLSPNNSRSRKFLDVDSGFSISGQSKSIISGSEKITSGPSSLRSFRSNKGSGSQKGRRLLHKKDVNSNINDGSVVSEVSIDSGEFVNISPRSDVTSPASAAITRGAGY